MVYELEKRGDDEITPRIKKLNNNLKYYNLENTPYGYYWATIIGSNQRVYGFFREVNVDFKTSMKINTCIPDNEKTLQWE